MTIERQVELNTKAIRLLTKAITSATADDTWRLRNNLRDLDAILAEFERDEAEAGK